MTITEKERKEMLEKELKREAKETWKIIYFSIKGILYLIVIMLAYITIEYTIRGFIFGFN